MKLSAPIWNEEFELLDKSSSISDIQHYFEYIFKKQGGNVINNNNPLIRTYGNKIHNRITFKVKAGYYFEYL